MERFVTLVPAFKVNWTVSSASNLWQTIYGAYPLGDTLTTIFLSPAFSTKDIFEAQTFEFELQMEFWNSNEFENGHITNCLSDDTETSAMLDADT